MSSSLRRCWGPRSSLTTPPAPASAFVTPPSPIQDAEDFDFTVQPGAEKPLTLHLTQLYWITERSNVCFFAPPGSASSKPSTATRSMTSCAASSATTCSSSTRFGYLPLERQAANLLFALVARRYQRGSIIVTSNRGFAAWGEILGDAMVAARSSTAASTTPRWSR